MVKKNFAAKVVLKLVDGVSIPLRKIESGLNRLDDPIAKFNKELGLTQRHLNSMTGNIKRLANAGVQLGSTLTRNLTLPITAGLTAAVVQFGRIEEGLADVAKTSGLSENELGKLNGVFGEFVKQNRISKTELLSFATAAAQAGVKGVDAIADISKQFAALSIATNIEPTQEGLTELVRTVNLLGLNAERDFGKVGATITRLGNDVEVSEREILAFSSQIASAFGGLKKSTPDLLALTAGVIAAKQNAESSATSFQLMGGEIEEAMRKNSVVFTNFANITNRTKEDFKTLFEENPAMAFIEVAKGMNRQVKEGVKMDTIFRALNINSERQKRVFAGLQETIGRTSQAVASATDEFNNYEKRAGKSDAATVELAKKNQTLFGRLRILGNTLLEVGEAFAEHIVPVLLPAIEAFGKFAKVLGALPGPVKQFILMGAIMLAVLGPLIASVSNLALGFLALKSIFGGAVFLKSLGLLSGAFTAIGLGFSKFLVGIGAVAGSPITAVVLAVISLANAAFKLHKAFSMLGDMPILKKIGTFFKAAVGADLSPEDLGINIAQAKPRRIPMEAAHSTTKEEIVQKSQLEVLFPNAPQGTRLYTPANPLANVSYGFSTAGP